MRVNFWGVRGSYPCWGTEKQSVGGQTSCVSVVLSGHDSPFIFDMGTGIIELGRQLLENDVRNIKLIVSHFHLDHVMGLPFFKPLWNKNVTLTFYAPDVPGEMTLETLLREKLFCDPLFPVPLDDIPATCLFKTFSPGHDLELEEGVFLQTLPLNHPGTATGYRLTHQDKSFCYMTDHEHSPEFDDSDLLTFVKETDLMLFDTMYTPHDMLVHKGWGHSSWQSAVSVAQKASVKNLALFHMSPDYTDEALCLIERDAQKEFRATFLAREGRYIEL